MRLMKDEVLNALAERGNVAQFVAFRPDSDGQPVQSFNRMAGVSSNFQFRDARDAVMSLMERAPEGTVNVRSFLPESPRSQEFIYGLGTIDEVMNALGRLTKEGLYTIVNETVDVTDGGISGVAQGDLVEFAPNDTPRCVEKPGTASLPFNLAIELLTSVYGFVPAITRSNARLEFSIHPRRRGTRDEHTLLWEYEEAPPVDATASLVWPNLFSRHIGDKAYGLLMASLLSRNVPTTTVISRRVAPFTFGEDTGSFEFWTRTCPVEPEPGLFTTVRGWRDPFTLLAAEDPDGSRIASVLAQLAVPASFAGAAVSGAKELIVEGTAGDGDSFMLGTAAPQSLPETVRQQVIHCGNELSSLLGPIRFEWVHDGQLVWIVQLHYGGTGSGGAVVVPGDADIWVTFDVTDGLEALRTLTHTIAANSGIELVGEVGLTSHIADVVRRAGIPTRIRVRHDGR